MLDETQGSSLRVTSPLDMGIATERSRPHVPVIVLDRPPVNALDVGTVLRLADVVESLDDRPAVLTTQGPHFSAGHDQTEVDRIEESGYLTTFGEALARILTAPAPLVGVMQGAAVGTGWILAACCEILVVTEDARVRLPEVERGLLGGAGHLARWIGAAWVRRAVLLGEDVPARALIANGALGTPDLTAARSLAVDIASRLAERDRRTVSAAREVLRGLSPDVVATHSDELGSTLVLRQRA